MKSCAKGSYTYYCVTSARYVCHLTFVSSEFYFLLLVINLHSMCGKGDHYSTCVQFLFECIRGLLNLLLM